MHAAAYRTEVQHVLELLHGYFGNLGPTLPWSLNRSASWASTDGTLTPTVFQIAAHIDKKEEFERIYRCYVDWSHSDTQKSDTPTYGRCFLVARAPKHGLTIFERSLACFACSTTGKLTEAAIAHPLKRFEHLQAGQKCPECKGAGWQEYQMRSSRLGRMVWLEQYQAPAMPETLADYEVKCELWAEESKSLGAKKVSKKKPTTRSKTPAPKLGQP
jgi:hypothetical protein